MALQPWRLKHVARQVAEKGVFEPEGGEYIGLENIISWTGQLDRSEFTTPEGLVSTFSPGDVLFGKLRPYLAKVHLAAESGSASTEAVVLRTGRLCRPAYLQYVMLDPTFIGAMTASVSGAKMPRATWQTIGSWQFNLPSLANQDAIIKYVAQRTRHIDNLISAKQKLVALLTEKLGSAIYARVTGQRSADASVATGSKAIPLIPQHWQALRIGALFRQSVETNDGTLPVLSVTIAGGVSDRELADDDRDRVVNKIEDRSAYKVVRPGDVAYNMMRAWQGALGAATVQGAVSPAYVVARPIIDLHSAYFEEVLRTPAMIEEMRRTSRGIADFRRRLYWQDFKNLIVPVPPLHEQEQIASEINSIRTRLLGIRSKIVTSITLLHEQRASVIHEAVTNSLVPNVVTPSLNTRVIVGAEIIHRHRTVLRFGRVKLQKLLYLAETHVGIDGLNGRYQREAAGPLDRGMLDDLEGELLNRDFYRKDGTDGGGITYAALSHAGQHVADLHAAIPDKVAGLRTLIDLARDLDTRATEMVTTLYAVWNDDLLDGRQISDDAIVEGVLDDWHPEKRAKFTATDLHHWLAWMKRNGLTPRGNGPRTIETMPKDLFAGSGNHEKGERR